MKDRRKRRWDIIRGEQRWYDRRRWEVEREGRVKKGVGKGEGEKEHLTVTPMMNAQRWPSLAPSLTTGLNFPLADSFLSIICPLFTGLPLPKQEGSLLWVWCDHRTKAGRGSQLDRTFWRIVKNNMILFGMASKLGIEEWGRLLLYKCSAYYIEAPFSRLPELQQIRKTVSLWKTMFRFSTWSFGVTGPLLYFNFLLRIKVDNV